MADEATNHEGLSDLTVFMAGQADYFALARATSGTANPLHAIEAGLQAVARYKAGARPWYAPVPEPAEPAPGIPPDEHLLNLVRAHGEASRKMGRHDREGGSSKEFVKNRSIRNDAWRAIDQIAKDYFAPKGIPAAQQVKAPKNPYDDQLQATLYAGHQLVASEQIYTGDQVCIRLDNGRATRRKAGDGKECVRATASEDIAPGAALKLNAYTGHVSNLQQPAPAVRPRQSIAMQVSPVGKHTVSVEPSSRSPLENTVTLTFDVISASRLQLEMTDEQAVNLRTCLQDLLPLTRDEREERHRWMQLMKRYGDLRDELAFNRTIHPDNSGLVEQGNRLIKQLARGLGLPDDEYGLVDERRATSGHVVDLVIDGMPINLRGRGKQGEQWWAAQLQQQARDEAAQEAADNQARADVENAERDGNV